MSLHAVTEWHKTSTGILVFALIELALAYAFASWAIDSGRLLAYFLAIVMLAGFAGNFIKLTARVWRHAR